LRPTPLPLCFVPEEAGQSIVVCPSAQSAAFPTGLNQTTGLPPLDIDDAIKDTASPLDVFFVTFLGFVGAAMSAAVSIRNVRGSSDPHSIPVALTLLKMPTGALTALIGIILIRAGLVPGIVTLSAVQK
jgi:hypothetical protein